MRRVPFHFMESPPAFSPFQYIPDYFPAVSRQAGLDGARSPFLFVRLRLAQSTLPVRCWLCRVRLQRPCLAGPPLLVTILMGRPRVSGSWALGCPAPLPNRSAPSAGFHRFPRANEGYLEG